MRKWVVAMLMASTVILSGCTTTVVIDPTAAPVVEQSTMTPEQAGIHYLSAACAMNSIASEFSAAIEGGDIAAIRDVAARGRDLASTAGQSLDSRSGDWPPEIANDIAEVAKTMYGLASMYDVASKIETPFDLLGLTPPADDGHASAQRIRGVLGLGADTESSCANR